MKEGLLEPSSLPNCWWYVFRDSYRSLAVMEWFCHHHLLVGLFFASAAFSPIIHGQWRSCYKMLAAGTPKTTSYFLQYCFAAWYV